MSIMRRICGYCEQKDSVDKHGFFFIFVYTCGRINVNIIRKIKKFTGYLEDDLAEADIWVWERWKRIAGIRQTNTELLQIGESDYEKN